MKKISLPPNYQCTLAVGAILVFFTNLDLYLMVTEIIPSQRLPMFAIITFIIASIPLLSSNKKYLPRAVIIWCAGYILVSLFSYSLSSLKPNEIAHQELESRILSVIFLLLTLLIFSKYYIVQLWARRAVLMAVLFAVFNNIYNLFNPVVSGPLGTAGRSAGFYGDPNISGAVLSLGMIFSVGLLQPRYRVPFVSLVGIGILLTLSRGAILGWLIVVIIFLNLRMIPQPRLFYWVVGLGLIVLGLEVLWGNLLHLDRLTDFNLLNQNALGGIEGHLSRLRLTDEEGSSEERLDVARLAWQQFVEHPLLGNGIGSAQALGVKVSTHNMYLLFMTEHGILGIFIFPLLVYLVIRHARGETKHIGFCFAAFILIWGLFNHNVLEQRFMLIIFSLMAAMSVTSQLEQRSQIEHKS